MTDDFEQRIEELNRQHDERFAWGQYSDQSGDEGEEQGSKDDEWPEPFDIWGKLPAPPLPEGLLPPIIEQFARINAAQIGCDPAGAAMAALAVCAAAIPDKIRIKPKRHDNWQECARIWVTLVGDPSTKKTPSMKKAATPLLNIDREQLAENNRLAQAWLADGGSKSGTPKPAAPRYAINDATAEAAGEVLKHSINGILIYQDELSGFFGRIEKYGGSGGSADRSFWLQAFGGGQYAVDRISRGSFIIENLSITLLGGIQPGPMRSVVSGAQDDGLIQRVFPIMLAPATKGQDAPAPDIDAQYDSLIENLTRLQPPPNFIGIQPVWFSDDARRIREELEERHLEMMALEASNSKLATHIGKYDGLFVRLCLLFHCIEHADSEIGLPDKVTGELAERVGRFLHGFLLRHAFAFYRDMIGATEGFDEVQSLAGYILTKRLEVVTVRDIQHSTGGKGGLKAFQAQEIAERLESLGWLHKIDTGRKNSIAFAVNPRVHAQFQAQAQAEAERRQKAQAIYASLGKR